MHHLDHPCVAIARRLRDHLRLAISGSRGRTCMDNPLPPFA